MIQVHHWGGGQQGSSQAVEEGMRKGTRVRDSSTTKIGRLDPETGPCWPAWSPPSSASSVQGLEIRGILLAGINVRLPHPSAASQRFWETRLQYLVLDNLYTQTHYKSGHLRLRHQTWFSLPCTHETSSSSRTDVPGILMLHACVYGCTVST